MKLTQVDGAADQADTPGDECPNSSDNVRLSNKDFNNYPILLTTNVRSIFPKLDSLCAQLEDQSVDIGFITEIWMNENNPLHTSQLDRKLHMAHFDFATNARQARRGGGVAIVVNLAKGYSMKRQEQVVSR